MKNFSEAKEFLFKHIPQNRTLKYPGSYGLNRTKEFLKLLGDPQDKLKAVHIAGTSGKGSTAYLTSLLLHSLGFKTGMTLSPHVVDIRERIQINNQLLSKEKFTKYLADLVPAIKKLKKSKYGSPTYFEILTVLAFYSLWKEKVDYSIIETGLGGMCDATNTITREDKISVITRIGFDHTKLLGNTLSKIAKDKTGIIHHKNKIIAIKQKSQVNKVIEEVAKKKKAKLVFIGKDNFSKIDVDHTKFEFRLSNIKLKVNLGMLGTHQVENCSLALATAFLLSQRDNFEFNQKKIRKCLSKAHFRGRFEIFELKNKKIVVDIAHNSQKIKKLTESLKIIFPSKKFDFLIAIKKDKNYSKMLKYITPIANKTIITTFFTSEQDLFHLCEEPENIRKFLKNAKIIKDPKEAFNEILLESKNPIVVTGSLYLMGEIYPLLASVKNFR